MHCLFLTIGPDIVASSRIRVLGYLPWIHQAGIKTRVIKLGTRLPYILAQWQPDNARLQSLLSRAKINVQNFNFRYTRWQSLYAIQFAARYDVIFLQKIILPTKIQHLLKSRNPRIIFDFDDALFKKPKYYGSEQRLQNQLKMSKTIIVGNTYLANYARQYTENVTIIPTPIDVERYRPSSCHDPFDDRIIIGWIGSPSTAREIEGREFVFKELWSKYPKFVLRIIGAPKTTLKGFPVECYSWRYATEVEMLQRFDIGVMPLEDTEWNRGKCGYKLLQYMAAGLPCVASPVGINETIIQQSNAGILAASGDEWIAALSALISSPGKRSTLGQAGREFVIKHYSYETLSPKLIQAIVSTTNHSI